ncbi:MAG: long-chain fatty acid--CoA ligase [Pseudomonadales bacterium]|jgi:long-chain acyl-CoA synthetase|nr:long-chain fatty acid--CoA ligase [Pseudomonadales bacterium]
MQLAQTLRRSARLHGERTALVDGDVRYSWRAFEERVARIAGGLRALGIGDGDRVAMLAHNSHRYVEFFFATFWAGGIAVPVNTRWAAPEVRHALDDSGARVLVVDPAHLEAGRAQIAEGAAVEHLVFAADAEEVAEGTTHWEALARGETVADANRGYEDVACLFYTGGTTGRSKGVMLTHANLVTNSMTAMLNMDIRSDTVHLHTSPMFHVAGGARLFSVTLAGGTHVVIPRFDVDLFLDVVERERITITIIVPTMLTRLVRHPQLEARDLSSLKLLSYGASPMPEAVLREALARMPGIRLLQSYGMTELSPVATVLGPEHHVFEGPAAGRTASAGRPVYNADVMIADPEDRPLPPGEIGEVCVRGPMVMKGYWNLPELSAETLRGGWMHTGDAGYLDDEGFLFVVDRIKDMIVSGGENVYSAEVEDAIHLHPAVAECAVIGIPDEQWGEAVHAVVVPKPGAALTADAVIEHCRRRIAGYKCPRSVEIRDGELPKSGPGKILKTDLRRPFWDSRDRAVN